MILRNSLFTFAVAASFVNAGAAIPVYQDETGPPDERVEDALSRMTLQEKVNMIHARANSPLPVCRASAYRTSG